MIGNYFIHVLRGLLKKEKNWGWVPLLELIGWSMKYEKFHLTYQSQFLRLLASTKKNFF